MRKLTILLLMGFIAIGHALAQRTITGIATDAENTPLTGVSILVDGTNIETITDAGGNYQFDVPEETTHLIFSYKGYLTEKLGLWNKSVQNATLTASTALAEEVPEQRSITGTIVDEQGEVLIGATILATNNVGLGTITDFDGKFELTIPAEVTALKISYTGFQEQKVDLTDGINHYDVVLFDDIIGLEDVIVIGYSPQKRKDLTGSVSSIKSADIENVPLPSFEAALQGRAAGVQVTKNSGKPGGGIDVSIRGKTSISASNQPLYVIDGVPLITGNTIQVGLGGSGTNALADLNPEDIENIEVLKDAATAAIYGSRAANGVVLITTKRGSKSGTKISLNASYGNQWLPNQIPVVDGPTYIEYITQQFGANIVGTEANTNWQDEVFRTSTIQNYNATITGGNTATQYYASLGYSDDEGIMRNTFFKRYSGRLNVNHIATDKLGFAMNMSYTQTDNRQIQNDNNIFGALGAAILIPPVVPIRNEDGSFGTAFGIENAVAAVTDYDNIVGRGRLIGNISATYNLLDNLTFKASLGTDRGNQIENIYEPRTLQSSNNGRAIVANAARSALIHDYVLNFNQIIGQGNLSAYIGSSFQEDRSTFNLAEAVNFPTDGFRGLSSGAEPVTTSGGKTGSSLNSYLGGINYNFGDKYYLTTTFRADGSSRFLRNKWGYFPGVSVAWNIANESFLADGPFSSLKLRGGWGQTGNNNIGDFAALQLFGGGANYLDNPGTGPTSLGNPDLKWETTTQTNVGLDFGFLKDRITGSLDFYIKTTNDLLLNRPIPTTSGFFSVLQNVGEVENKGIDLTINTLNINRKNISWNTTFILGYLENRVLKLVDGIPFDDGFANRIAEGQPLGAFFGHVTDGIFQNQAEIDAHATQPNAAPGDIRFLDISGGAGPDGIVATADDLPPDGIINDDDRTFIGKALPDFTGGLTNTLNIYGVEIAAFFQFSQGVEIMNFNNVFAEGLNSVFAPTQRAYDNAWRAEGDITETPRIVLNDPNNNRRNSDRFVEKGDYIRLKTLTVGYQLPKTILAKVKGISSLRIYATGYNLWTITDYSWFDPEVNIFDGANTALGSDFLTFPQPRSIVFGINLGF